VNSVMDFQHAQKAVNFLITKATAVSTGIRSEESVLNDLT
jgi:hypothetical protein